MAQWTWASSQVEVLHPKEQDAFSYLGCYPPGRASPLLLTLLFLDSHSVLACGPKVSMWTTGTISNASGQPHFPAWLLTAVKLTEQGPVEPTKSKELRAPQPRGYPWRGGGVVQRRQLERPC